MKYFTFIGLGNPKNGYTETIYSFEDDINQVSVSKFVQKPIVDRYCNEIEKIYIFSTKQAYDRHSKEIMEELSDYEIEFIHINMNIDFHDFVNEMLQRIQSNDRIMIDITHSFRSIPMKLLFALKYIESSKNVSIEHLFYGKQLPQENEGMIIDIIHDYEMQKASDLLAQFDRTLIISSKDIEQLVEKDKKINAFLVALSQFNQMIELCEFDRCTKTVEKILENCRSLEKEADLYILVMPMVSKIKDKFSKYMTISNNQNKKIELIKMLIQHGRYQIAVTFTDQFFREELIRSTLDSDNMNFDLNLYLSKHQVQAKPELAYRLSQVLILNIYQLRKGNSYSENDSDIQYILKDKEKTFEKNQHILNGYKQIINSFYSEIRNHMNHGTSIEKKDKIENTIFSLLDCIQKLGRRE